jgi:hypothetical protein
MLKGPAITVSYTAGITALLMLLFPKFRADIELIWYNLTNGGSLGLNLLGWVSNGNFFPAFLALCGMCTGFLLWWHNRPN